MTPATNCGRSTRHDPTYQAYRQGCRCDATRHATFLWRKHHRLGYRHHLAAHGARHRIQALYALGHTTRHIAASAGLSIGQISGIAHARTRIHRRSHNAILNVYTQLRDTPGPSEITRTRAAKYGWWTPTQWDQLGQDWLDEPDPPPNPTMIDQAAIVLAAAGKVPIDNLTPREQSALYHLLHHTHNLTDGQIRYRLGLSAAQVGRLARNHQHHQEDTNVHQPAAAA